MSNFIETDRFLSVLQGKRLILSSDMQDRLRQRERQKRGMIKRKKDGVDGFESS